MKYIFFAIVTFLGIAVSQCRHVSSPHDNVDLDFHLLASKTRKSESASNSPLTSFNVLKEAFNALTLEEKVQLASLYSHVNNSYRLLRFFSIIFQTLDNDDTTSFLAQQIDPVPVTETVTFSIGGHLTTGWRELKKLALAVIDRFRGTSQASPAPVPQDDSAQSVDPHNSDNLESANNLSVNGTSTQADTMPNGYDTNLAPFNATTNQYTPVDNAQDQYYQPKPYSGNSEDNYKPLNNEIQTDGKPTEYDPYSSSTNVVAPTENLQDNEPTQNSESQEVAADSRPATTDEYDTTKPAPDSWYDNSQTTTPISTQDDLPEEQVAADSKSEPTDEYGATKPAPDSWYDNSQTAAPISTQDDLPEPEEQENNMNGIPQTENTSNVPEFVIPRAQSLDTETETKSNELPVSKPKQLDYPIVLNEEEKIQQNETDREERKAEVISKDESIAGENAVPELQKILPDEEYQPKSTPAEDTETQFQKDIHDEPQDESKPAEEVGFLENTTPEFTDSQKESVPQQLPEVVSQLDIPAPKEEVDVEKQEQPKPKTGTTEEGRTQENIILEFTNEPQSTGLQEESVPGELPEIESQPKNVLHPIQKDVSSEAPEKANSNEVPMEEVKENTTPEFTNELQAPSSQKENLSDVAPAAEFQLQSVPEDSEPPFQKDARTEAQEETKENVIPEEQAIQESKISELATEPQVTGSQEFNAPEVIPGTDSQQQDVQEDIGTSLEEENIMNEMPEETKPNVVSEEEPRIQENSVSELATEPQVTGSQEFNAPETIPGTESQPQDIQEDIGTSLEEENIMNEMPEETKLNSVPEEEVSLENTTPEFTTSSQEEATPVSEEKESPFQTEVVKNSEESPAFTVEPQTAGAEEEELPTVELPSVQESINNNQVPRVDENQSIAELEENPSSFVPEAQLDLGDNNVPATSQNQIQEDLNTESLPVQLERESNATPTPINEKTELTPIQLDENTIASPVTVEELSNQSANPRPAIESLNELSPQEAPIEFSNRFQALSSEEPELQKPAKPTPESSSGPVNKGLREEQLKILDSQLDALNKVGVSKDGLRNLLSRLSPEIVKQLAQIHNENNNVKTTASPNIATPPEVEQKFAKPVESVPAERGPVRPPKKSRAQKKAEKRAKQLAAGGQPYQRMQPRRITIDL